MFGGYEGDLMLKPDNETMQRVRGTFLEFLIREDLEPLKIIFKISMEVYGRFLAVPIFQNQSDRAYKTSGLSKN